MTNYNSRYSFVCYPETVKIYDNVKHTFVGQADTVQEAEKKLKNIKK